MCICFTCSYSSVIHACVCVMCQSSNIVLPLVQAGNFAALWIQIIYYFYRECYTLIISCACAHARSHTHTFRQMCPLIEKSPDDLRLITCATCGQKGHTFCGVVVPEKKCKLWCSNCADTGHTWACIFVRPIATCMFTLVHCSMHAYFRICVNNHSCKCVSLN